MTFARPAARPPCPSRGRVPLAGRVAAAVVSSCLVAVAAHAAAPATGTAYVSNQNGDVSVIDLATMKVTGSISPYGKEPRGIGVTADGKLLVVANREGGRIAVIDRASGKLLRHVPIGANPEFVRTRGHFAFVSFEPASTGQAPPRASGASQPGTPHPEGGASGPGGKDDDDDADKQPAQVAVVDLDQGKVVRSIVGGRETEGIEFTADGKHILVTNEADDNVSVHEIATGKRVKVIDTKAYGKRPRGVKLSPDGKSYVVTLEFANAFIVLDNRYEVVKTVRTGESPYGISFNRAGDRLFVAAAKSKLLQVFDAKTWEPVKDVPIGNRCWHFTFTPDDRHVLLACGRSDEVVVVDAVKLEVVEHISDKALPWGVVTYPKSMGSLDRPE
jgi:YVTN family beta-propeller protein